MTSVMINKATDIVTRNVILTGMADIMFDRYPGDNSTKLEPHQKLYFQPGDSRVIGIPSVNIMSCLSAHNTNSCNRSAYATRGNIRIIANLPMLSFVGIRESFIPLLRNGAPIQSGRSDSNT